MDGFPAHISRKQDPAGREGMKHDRAPSGAVDHSDDLNDPGLSDCDADTDIGGDPYAAHNDVHYVRLCLGRQTGGRGYSLGAEVKEGLEQKECDDEIEGQEQRRGNGEVSGNGAIDLRQEQNDEERHRDDEPVPATALSRRPTSPVWVMPANQAATGFRKVQAAQRSKPKTRKLVNSCQAEIPSGGVSMAVGMRKTSRKATIDAITADSRQ
jgi:hypothetical protein